MNVQGSRNVNVLEQLEHASFPHTRGNVEIAFLVTTGKVLHIDVSSLKQAQRVSSLLCNEAAAKYLYMFGAFDRHTSIAHVVETLSTVVSTCIVDVRWEQRESQEIHFKAVDPSLSRQLELRFLSECECFVLDEGILEVDLEAMTMASGTCMWKLYRRTRCVEKSELETSLPPLHLSLSGMNCTKKGVLWSVGGTIPSFEWCLTLETGYLHSKAQFPKRTSFIVAMEGTDYEILMIGNGACLALPDGNLAPLRRELVPLNTPHCVPISELFSFPAMVFISESSSVRSMLSSFLQNSTVKLTSDSSVESVIALINDFAVPPRSFQFFSEFKYEVLVCGKWNDLGSLNEFLISKGSQRIFINGKWCDYDPSSESVEVTGGAVKRYLWTRNWRSNVNVSHFLANGVPLTISRDILMRYSEFPRDFLLSQNLVHIEGFDATSLCRAFTFLNDVENKLISVATAESDAIYFQRIFQFFGIHFALIRSRIRAETSAKIKGSAPHNISELLFDVESSDSSDLSADEEQYVSGVETVRNETEDQPQLSSVEPEGPVTANSDVEKNVSASQSCSDLETVLRDTPTDVAVEEQGLTSLTPSSLQSVLSGKLTMNEPSQTVPDDNNSRHWKCAANSLHAGIFEALRLDVSNNEVNNEVQSGYRMPHLSSPVNVGQFQIANLKYVHVL